MLGITKRPAWKGDNRVSLVFVLSESEDSERVVGYPEVIHFHPFGHAGGADTRVVPPPR